MHAPWDIILTVIVTVIGSGGFWTLVQHRLETRDKRRSALEAGVISLLHDRVYYIAETHIQRECISFSEFDNLTHLYDAYNALGGNSNGEDLYVHVKALPRLSDADAEMERRKGGLTTECPGPCSLCGGDCVYDRIKTEKGIKK